MLCFAMPYGIALMSLSSTAGFVVTIKSPVFWLLWEQQPQNWSLRWLVDGSLWTCCGCRLKQHFRRLSIWKPAICFCSNTFSFCLFYDVQEEERQVDESWCRLMPRPQHSESNKRAQCWRHHHSLRIIVDAGIQHPWALTHQFWHVEYVLSVQKVSRDKSISDGQPVQAYQGLQGYFWCLTVNQKSHVGSVPRVHKTSRDKI